MKLRDIDVLILCGGKGKRLKSVVSDKPKPLAEIKGKPFLDYLLEYLKKNNFIRFVLCIGYKSGQIKKYYKNKDTGIEILFSNEKIALGTAGAVKNAEHKIKKNPFMVMNGDSFCKINFDEFLNFHLRKKGIASMVLVNAKKPIKDFGTVKMDRFNRIIEFKEKNNSKKQGFVNAGVYLFDKKILKMIPLNKNVSLEYDIFPKIKDCFGFISNDEFIDIGTPERLNHAKSIMPEINIL